jgi:hypothetical protein
MTDEAVSVVRADPGFEVGAIGGGTAAGPTFRGLEGDAEPAAAVFIGEQHGMTALDIVGLALARGVVRISNIGGFSGILSGLDRNRGLPRPLACGLLAGVDTICIVAPPASG